MSNELDKKGTINVCNAYSNFSITLQESLQNIIKEEGYVKHRMEIKIVPEAGNFLSSLYEVDIDGEIIDGNKTTSLFIKKRVTLEKITLANVSDAFSRELFVYNELSRIFLSLQEAAHISNKERFKLLKCYSSNDEAIIMDNLSKKGFTTYNGQQVVQIKFAELAIIELAKFHALSYVIKTRIPKYFNSKIRTIKHLFNLTSDWDEFIHNVCAATAQVVEGEAKDKIQNYAPIMLKFFKKLIKDIIPLNGCLCHGDYKILNVLVKEVDGKASEVQPIDFQLVYYGNPLDDFLFFIFTGTDREFRKKHLNYLKDLYFENFTKFLQHFNIDVNMTYSRQEFENDYKERLGLGLVYGLFVSAFTFGNAVEGFDVQTRALSELPVIPTELFAERVRGIVEDYIEWGYL